MFSIMAILCWLVLLEGKNNQLCVSRVTLLGLSRRKKLKFKLNSC